MKKLCGIVILSSVLISSCGPNLQETGIPSAAFISAMRESGYGTKQRCYITVNFFTDPSLEDPLPEKKRDSNETIDEIIANLNIDTRIGDYTTAEIEIPKSEYSSYDEGDEVKIKYEKGNPTNAVIAEE